MCFWYSGCIMDYWINLSILATLLNLVGLCPLPMDKLILGSDSLLGTRPEKENGVCTPRIICGSVFSLIKKAKEDYFNRPGNRSSSSLGSMLLSEKNMHLCINLCLPQQWQGFFFVGFFAFLFCAKQEAVLLECTFEK